MNKIKKMGRGLLVLSFCIVCAFGNLQAEINVPLRETLSFNGDWKTKALSRELLVKNSKDKKVYMLEDFEDVSDWWGKIGGSTEHVKEGKYSGKYTLPAFESMPSKLPTGYRAYAGRKNIPHDWENFEALEFWCYSPEKNYVNMKVVLTSESESEDWDAFVFSIKVDWVGWKKITLNFDKAGRKRKPAGWNKIDSILFCFTADGRTKLENLMKNSFSLYLDQMVLIPQKEILVKKPFNEGEGIINKWYSSGYNDNGWQKITIPHRRRKKDKDNYWYRRRFTLPESFKDKRIILKFDLLSYVSWLWINGEQVSSKKYEVDKKYPNAVNQAVMTGCEFDITDYLKFNSENLIAIKIFLPGEIGCSPYRTPGCGIARDVKLLALPDIYTSRVLITPDIDTKSVKVNVLVRNARSFPFRGSINYKIIRYNDKCGEEKGEGIKVTVPANTEKEVEFKIEYNKGMILWSPDNPQLYNLELSLVKNDSLVDAITERFGFRKFETRGKRFYLNGKSFFIKGASHVPDVAKQHNGLKDFKTTKDKFNINMIRFHTYPARDIFHNMADEQGMLIMSEGKGLRNRLAKTGKYNKKEKLDEYERVYIRELPRWFYAHYNHPSIVIWSLENEEWNIPISFQNKRYELAKKIDPSRPILTSAGGTTYGMGGMASSVYKDYKTDIDDIHCYDGWYRKPILHMEDWINFCANEYEGQERPLINTETVGRYVYVAGPIGAGDGRLEHGPWPRWLGHKILEINSIEKRLYLATKKCAEGIKISVEMWRMRKGDTAGSWVFCDINPNYSKGFNYHIDMLKKVFSPVFTCARFYDKNYFTGDKVQFPLYVINDKQEKIKNTKVKLQVTDKDNNVLLERAYDFGIIEKDGIKQLPAGFEIGKWPQGDYKLNLILTSGSEQILENDYRFFVMPEKLMNKQIITSKRVLLLDSNNKTADILKSLKVNFIKKISLNNIDLNKFGVLIIGANFSGDISSEEMEQWVKRGGRILCLEQEPRNVTKTVKSLCPFFNAFYTYSSSHHQANSFVDVCREKHLIFKKLSPEQFEDWNGDYNVLTDGFFEPYNELKRYTLAQVRSSGLWNYTSRPGSAVLNFAYGKGEYLITQLQAVKRWGNDPIATNYIQNLFEYMLTQESVAKVECTPSVSIGTGPFNPDKDGFIRHFLICGPFPNPGGRPYYSREVALKNQLGFDKDFIREAMPTVGGWKEECEKDIEPVPGLRYRITFPKTKEGYWNIKAKKEIECIWNGAVSSDVLFPLLSRFAFQNNIAAYAACYVECPKDIEAKIKIGSDDGYKMWLNHELVGSLCTFRGVTRDSEAYTVKLKKGINRVLIKIIQDTGGFGFCLRFTDLNDKPLTDLKVWLRPNK